MLLTISIITITTILLIATVATLLSYLNFRIVDKIMDGIVTVSATIGVISFLSCIITSFMRDIFYLKISVISLLSAVFIYFFITLVTELRQL